MSSATSDDYRVGYARISTLDQDDARLTAAGCARVFTDRVSGSLEHRPALDAMVDQLRSGDTVVVWRLDRLGRSLRNLIDLVAMFDSGRIGFVSLTENIDTTTPGGRLVFHLFGALAEFERDLIRERTHAGLSAARVRGRRGGRPTVWTEEKLRIARQLALAGESVSAIGTALGVSRASVYRGLGTSANLDKSG